MGAAVPGNGNRPEGGGGRRRQAVRTGDEIAAEKATVRGVANRK